MKGAEKAVAVSDSMLAAGLPYGEYDFSGLHVTVGENGARLDSGNLAGSTITIAEGVKNIIDSGISLDSALMSGTSSPAKAMGIDDTCGFLRKGRKADILILNDNNTIRNVMKNGEII
jgi:N-acetylglucosamine-6-phosphate deacetylase